jgi:fatty acid desaturase
MSAGAAARVALDDDLAAVPAVAWPTVALTAAVALLALLGAWLRARGAWAPGALCVYLAGWGGFAVLHEASHGNVARARWLNALAGEIAAAVMLCRFLAFRQIHQRHHRHTNDPTRDPDHFSGAGPAWQRALRLAATDLHYYFEYDPGALRASTVEHALSWASALALVACIAALVATGHGVDFVLGWALPIRASMFTAALLADYLPHRRPAAVPRAAGGLAHTAQLAPSPLVDALTLCHSHHLLHHLWPRVPFYRLPAAWRRHGEALRARGAAVRWR